MNFNISLVDMSGGIEETYNLKEIRNFRTKDLKNPDHNTFWNILIKARQKSSVIGCNIDVKHKQNVN